jgi:hypothetical protein
MQPKKLEEDKTFQIVAQQIFKYFSCNLKKNPTIINISNLQKNDWICNVTFKR